MILQGIIASFAFLLIGYYLIYYAPTKERKERHNSKALELTKDIGNRKISCISLTTNRFNGGRVFYIIEDGAEVDPNKYICKLNEGWTNSAYTVEEARRDVEEIIQYMPYSIYWIKNLDISETEYFKHRNHTKKLQEVNNRMAADQERMNMYFFPDFMNNNLSIIRFSHTIKQTNYNEQFYYYIMLVIDNKIEKYITLFDYPAYDEEYANLRAENYITYYNKNNPFGGKINTTINYNDQELCDFLKTHPFYTHQYLYRSLKSIEPYYEPKCPT